MKRNFVKTFIVCTLLLLFHLPTQAAETLILDSQHTYVLWRIKHFGFSTQVGKWYVSGTLTLDKDNPQNSKVNATVQLANMITGIDELDKHLKSELFFDVKQFPTATFVSDKVDVIDKTTAKVHGILTLHGMTKPVTLNVTFNQSGMNPITDQMTYGFSANTTVKRSDFGINALPSALGDEVNIDIEAEAYRPKK